MKKLLTLFLALTGVLAVNASVIIDNISYTEDETNWTAEVSMCNKTGDIEIPETISFDNKTFTVTSVNGGAFYEKTGITSVVLPNTVTLIWPQAFANCADLKSVTLGDGLEQIQSGTFSNCTALREITIPANVYTIEEHAFDGCTNLETVTLLSESLVNRATGYSTSNNFVNRCGSQVTHFIIGDDVTGICSYAFAGGANIREVTIGKKVRIIGGNAFKDCTGLTSIDIPEGVESINNNAFGSCTNLANVSLPESLLSIASNAFSNCNELESIEIPGSETMIGNGAFSGCTKLLTVSCNSNTFWSQSFNSQYPASNYFGAQVTAYTIGDDVETIGKNAFYSMTDVASVTLGEGLKTISEDAFWGCTGLTGISFPAGLTSIGARAFRSCSGLLELELPDGLSTLGGNAFTGCSGLESVTFGNTLTSISVSAFGGCTSLKTVNFGTGLLTIGNDAFDGCSALQSVDLPESLTTLGGWVFVGCDLLSVEIPKNVTAIGPYAFDENPNMAEVTIHSNDFLSQNFSSSGSLIKYFGDYTTHYIIGDEVETIGTYAFYNLQSLTSVTLGSGLKTISDDAFFYCNNLASVTLPEGLETIGESAFKQDNLTSISIPSTVTSIGQNAFTGNAGLLDVTILSQNIAGANTYSQYSNLQHIFGSQVNHYIFGGNVTSIGNNALYNATSLTNLEFGSGLKTIGENAFIYCTSLPSVVLPNGVETIEEQAFLQCEALTSVTLGDSLQSIGKQAFGYCYDLPSIVIGHMVTNVGPSAFIQCESLRTVTVNSEDILNGNTWLFSVFGSQVTHYIIGDSIQTIGDDDFHSAGFNQLTEVTIGKNVKTIGDQAFQGRTGLTSIVIPDKVTTIRSSAFRECANITSLTLGEGLKSIYSNAFNACRGLETVSIPAGVTNIGDYAFANCDNLTTVYNYAETPQDVGDIGSYADWDLKVPCMTKGVYEAANGWKTCKSISEFGCATFNITWLNEDGTTIETTECGQGEIPSHDAPAKENTAKYTYTFKAWDPEPVAAIADATYKATFDSTINTYMIKWVYEGGALIDQDYVAYGETPTHADPTKISPEPNRYTLQFKQWSPEIVPVTEEATYTAIFDTIPVLYTIRFLNYDGTELQTVPTEYEQKPEYTGETPIHPADDNYAYVFAGWDPEVEIAWRDFDYTAVYDTLINTVALTVQYPDFKAYFEAGRYYEAQDINTMNVECENEEAYFFAGADFWLEGYQTYAKNQLEPNTEYLVRFYVQAQEGFSFDGVSGDNIFVNGVKPVDISIAENGAKLLLSTFFNTGSNVIDEVHVFLTTAYPNYGEKIREIGPDDPDFGDFGSVYDGAPYQISNFRYFAADWSNLTVGEPFQPNTTYILAALISPQTYYTFPLLQNGFVDLEAMIITVNDEEVAPELMYSASKAFLVGLSFTTDPTGIESIQDSEGSVQKVVRNGQLIILRGNKTFNALGVEVR